MSYTINAYGSKALSFPFCFALLDSVFKSLLLFPIDPVVYVPAPEDPPRPVKQSPAARQSPF